MVRNEFIFPSADGKTGIHAVDWAPETAPRAVLLVSHGVSEHILRYEPLAAYLTERGFAVAVVLHVLGHILQNRGAAHHPDKDVAVVHNRHKILIHRGVEQRAHIGGDRHGLVIPPAREARNRHILARIQIKAVQVLNAPQDIALGDGADILAVAAQHRDGGKALV